MPFWEKDIQLSNAQYPWPHARPHFEAAERVLDGNGKKLVFQHIGETATILIVEIGAFPGSSARRWLAVVPNVYVIAIDPREGAWWEEYAGRHRRAALAEQFSSEDGPYQAFLSPLLASRRRLFPVRATLPDKHYEFAEPEKPPGQACLDSNKTEDDTAVAHRLFPEAILTGHDWTRGPERGYPIPAAMNNFAGAHNYRVISDWATWVLKRGSFNLSDRVCNILSSARDMVRAPKWLVS